MKKYIVTSDGNVVGSYSAETAASALQAMVEDAGYETLEALCEAGCSEPDDFEVFETL